MYTLQTRCLITVFFCLVIPPSGETPVLFKQVVVLKHWGYCIMQKVSF
jgi:hypothetical protein